MLPTYGKVQRSGIGQIPKRSRRICTLRINKYLQLERFVRERFPDSKWAQRLATISEQAQKLHEHARLRLIEKEGIPNAEKMYSLLAPHTRWIRKGKAPPKEVERGVSVTICQCTLRIILWWNVMWPEVDVDLTKKVLGEVKLRFPKVYTIRFDRELSGEPGGHPAPWCSIRFFQRKDVVIKRIVRVNPRPNSRRPGSNML